MDERTPAAEQPLLADGKATRWSQAREHLEAPERERTYWPATVAPDGRPHVRPLLGLWLDGAFYFVTPSRRARGATSPPTRAAWSRPAARRCPRSTSSSKATP
jgi:hypothetical protein